MSDAIAKAAAANRAEKMRYRIATMVAVVIILVNRDNSTTATK